MGLCRHELETPFSTRWAFSAFIVPVVRVKLQASERGRGDLERRHKHSQPLSLRSAEKSSSPSLFFSVFLKAMLNTAAAGIYEFGEFRLVPTRMLLLRRDGEVVPLPPKAFDLLQKLIESGGRVLTKEELLNEVWRGSFVEEGNLTQNISILRKALGENRGENRYIATVPGRGYRFVAAIKEVGRAPSAAESQPGAQTEASHEPGSSSAVSALGQLQEVRPGRAAESRPAKRPLNSVVLVALLLLAGLGIFATYSLWTKRPQPPVSVGEVKSIAVLPFKQLSVDGSDEYLGLGMADTLITKLSHVRQIIVRPTGAVRKYMAPDQDPLAAGREQRVDAVLDGGIQKSGDKVRVTVRLLRVADGATLWASQFDQKLTDIFAVQEAISERVAGTLALELTSEERKLLTKRHTENTEAYQLYLKGRYFLNKRTREDIHKAREYFEQAVELDPNNALAYLGLGDCYHQSVYFTSTPPRELIPKAKAMAKKALEIDPSLGEAHALLSILTDAEWDWNEALKEGQLAINLSPGSPRGHHLFAYIVGKRGRFDEALAAIRKAGEIDPTNLVISADTAAILCYAGRYDEAIEQCHKTLELDQNFSMAHAHLGIAYWGKGMYNEALGPLRKAVEIEGEESVRMMQLAMGYGFAGQKYKAQEFLTKLKKRAKVEYVDPTWIAGLYASIGDKDRALDWIEKAYDERSPTATALLVDTRFNTLRSDPRYQAILSRMGLAP